MPPSPRGCGCSAGPPAPAPSPGTAAGLALVVGKEVDFGWRVVNRLCGGIPSVSAAVARAGPCPTCGKWVNAVSVPVSAQKPAVRLCPCGREREREGFTAAAGDIAEIKPYRI